MEIPETGTEAVNAELDVALARAIRQLIAEAADPDKAEATAA